MISKKVWRDDFKKSLKRWFQKKFKEMISKKFKEMISKSLKRWFQKNLKRWFQKNLKRWFQNNVYHNSWHNMFIITSQYIKFSEFINVNSIYLKIYSNYIIYLYFKMFIAKYKNMMNSKTWYLFWKYHDW